MIKRTAYLFILLASLSLHAQAQVEFTKSHDSSTPVEITADSLEVLQAENKAIFSGDVQAKQGSLDIRSTKMTVFYTKAGQQESQGRVSKVEIDNNVFVNSVTATISSISSTISNQAVLNLSATLTGGFAVGGLLLISNNLKVPILGGTEIAPVVRWENVSTSASTSLTVGCIWGQRITYSAMNIASSGTTATVTQTATVQLTSNYKGRVGDLLMIPYSNISGTNGSSILYGTFQISNITFPSADIAAYTIVLPQTLAISENNIGNITVLQQINCKAVLSAEDVVLGYRNKMRAPMHPLQDDLSNGLI